MSYSCGVSLSSTSRTRRRSSWLNQVERFFGLLTDRRIRRGTFGSVRELESAIRDYLVQHNQNSEPFTWTADADSILKKITRLISFCGGSCVI